VRVVFAGGGTAGHVEPALATAEALLHRYPDAHVDFLGTESGLEARLVPARGFALTLIPRVPMPRRPSADVLALPSRLTRAVGAARKVIDGADCVVGFGGYVATPAYLAARKAGVPVVVHEQNMRPGLANRLGARMTPYVGVAFPETALPHARFVGLPLRSSLRQLAEEVAADRSERNALARQSLGLSSDRPIVVITGGSQGSQRINAVVADALDDLLSMGAEILHAVGEKNALPLTRPNYHPVPYLHQMEEALAAADVLIGRSGAGTCSEAAAIGVPAIFVPLAIGNGEQALNAAGLVAAGGAMLIEDPDFNRHSLLAGVRTVLSRVPAMRLAMQGQARLDAADRLVDLIEEAVRGD
jgi:undecaprenyldiphospho-muramoylpentapeptide beta-N-acetylglucosaminyltransferase